jgi:hypothetical protein
VLTLATGKPLYLRLAVNLARSFKWWHQDSPIRFTLATDQVEALPEDLSDLSIIRLEPGELGEGFSPKLYLNRIAPADQTLFVDADCLCTGPLDPVFDRFEGHDVSVIGRHMAEGEWFGNVKAVCEQFDVPALPRFNGGLYYLEPGDTCEIVYKTAQQLEDRYDEIGFKRLRGGANEEVLMALSMAIHDQEPVPDDGTIMNTTLEAPGGTQLDVLRGTSRMLNPHDHPDHFEWGQHTEMNPRLVHFLGYQTTRHPYRREEIRLRLAVAKGWPVLVADAWAALRFSIPWLTKESIKDVLRPLYHRLFDPREVQKTALDR